MSSSAKRVAARARRAAAAADPGKEPKRLRSDPAAAASASTDPPPSIADKVLAAERNMSIRLTTDLWYDPPTAHIYDPFKYAWDAHEWYTREYGNSRKEILLVGMNPTPWGMMQTGIPFGEVSAVRDWLRMPKSVANTIGKPEEEHPKRPVEGLQCPRSDVCGHRFWNEWARATHGDNPHLFFDRYFVYNYCPLLFLEESGKARTPNLMHPYERRKITEICDEALREAVRALRPRMVIGIGGWAMERSRFALRELVKKGLLINSVMHPSPSSQLANQGWARKAKRKMQECIAEMAVHEDVWAPKTGRS